MAWLLSRSVCVTSGCQALGGVGGARLVDGRALGRGRGCQRARLLRDVGHQRHVGLLVAHPHLHVGEMELGLGDRHSGHGDRDGEEGAESNSPLALLPRHVFLALSYEPDSGNRGSTCPDRQEPSQDGHGDRRSRFLKATLSNGATSGLAMT
jgi:hypothetical protein